MICTGADDVQAVQLSRVCIPVMHTYTAHCPITVRNTREAPVRTRTTNARLPLAVLTAVALTTAACGGEPADDLPPAASPPPAEATAAGTPGLDLSPTEQEAVDEARAQFDRFMNAYIDVSTADIPTATTAEDLFAKVDSEIGREFSSELRGEIVGDLWSERRVVAGTLEWDPVDVVGVDLAREVDGGTSPKVDLRYCVDVSDWIQVDAETRMPITTIGSPHLWLTSVVWWDDWGGLGQGPEGWRVVERDELVDQAC